MLKFIKQHSNFVLRTYSKTPKLKQIHPKTFEKNCQIMIKSWAWDGQKYFQKLKRLSIPVELFRNFLCLFLRQLWYPSDYIFYRCINFTPFNSPHLGRQGQTLLGRGSGQHINFFWIITELWLLCFKIHEKIGATFFMVSVKISICLKNPSQNTIFCTLSYKPWKNSPQINL